MPRKKKDVRRGPRRSDECAWCAYKLRKGWRWYSDYMGGKHRMHAACLIRQRVSEMMNLE
jgi:hypothetical protein